MIKALPTTYNGVQFRSRTEARWAAYFDLMGVEWRYEDEAYELPSGGYLPDFYLPKHDVFAEVKGDDGFDFDAIRKVWELSKHARKRVLLLDGPPANTTYYLISVDPWYLEENQYVIDQVNAGRHDDRGDGGYIWMFCWLVPLNHRKDRFASGDWWLDYDNPFIPYGDAWIPASDKCRSGFLYGDGPSAEAAIVRNATTTRAGELIIRRRAS